jgi:hypothetical protein
MLKIKTTVVTAKIKSKLVLNHDLINGCGDTRQKDNVPKHFNGQITGKWGCSRQPQRVG